MIIYNTIKDNCVSVKKPHGRSRAVKTAIAIFALLFVFCLLFPLSFLKTRADTSLSFDLFSPSSEKEIPDFGSSVPLSAFYSDDLYAFVMDDNGLYFNIDDEYFYYDNFTVKNPTSIKRLNSSTLLLLNNAILYTVDLSDLTKETEQYFFGSEPISGRCFDVSDEYLATVDGNTIFIYAFENGIPSEKTTLLNIAKNSTPLCLNASGKLFYVSANGKLVKYDVASRGATVLSEDVGAINKMIANDDTVYYTSPSAMYAVDVKTGEKISLTAISDGFELGSFSFSSDLDIAFKNDNLLITDPSLGAVQEFKVNGNELVFTGFAVASGKTAFNRISKTASAISCANNSLAVLDSFKLTVVKDLSKSLYLKDNFLNIPLSEMPFVPDMVSVGDGTVMLAGKTNKKIAVLSITDGNFSYAYSFSDNNITDVCYGGGYYYVAQIATGSGDDAVIYKIAETATDGTPEKVLVAENNFGSSTLVSADVYGNIVLSKGGNVYRIIKQNDGYGEPVKINAEPIDGVIKISTDISGNVFVLQSDGVSYISDGEQKKLPLSPSQIKSFDLSFDKKSVFFIRNNDERIYKTDLLPNLAADGITVPTEFLTAGDSANVEDLKIYALNDGAVCYKVLPAVSGEKFVYEKTERGAVNEYILICAVEYETADPVNGNLLSVSFSALLGRDQNRNPVFVLAETSGLTEITDVSETAKTRYITTDVSAYYLPMITEYDDFCLKDGDGILRLKAKTEITVISEITFSENGFGGKFLYAALKNSDGETVFGYIPENFTVDVLSENKEGKTIVSQIKSENSSSLRNALIVIALAASVFGTSAFFMIRKKS